MSKKKPPKPPKDTGKKKDDSDIKRQKIKAPVDCKLTDKEIAKLAKDHVATLAKITAKEAQKKAAADAIKADIELLEEAAGKLRDLIRDGTEERNIDCELEMDWRKCEVRLIRLDTKEVVKTRTMTADEKQKELVDLGPKAAQGRLLLFEGGKKKESEVKDAKKPGAEEPERKKPEANDAIEVETRSGWKKGKVLPSSGSVLDVELDDGTKATAPVEGKTWRWFGEGEKLATLGEIAKANLDKKPDKRLRDGAPAVADPLMVKTPSGMVKGTVARIDGTTMFVDIGDGGGMPVQVDLASKDWAWPKGDGDGGSDDEEKAPAKNGKGRKAADEVDTTPPEGCDF